jgi:glycosyltransferase involved in cell wall biosynthesis
VGTREPRKNLRRLLAAYARLDGDAAVPLALAGADGWLEEGLDDYIHDLGISERVFRLGYVDDATLAWLYGHCLAVVYPSLVEGFGLPVLEAMTLGAAVITSDRSSLPEVAGGAALLVDAASEESLHAAMRQVAGDRRLRERLRGAAAERAAAFSWRASARQVLEIYTEAVARPSFREERP